MPKPNDANMFHVRVNRPETMEWLESERERRHLQSISMTKFIEVLLDEKADNEDK